MRVQIIEALEQVPAEQWNRLDGGIDNPFLRHEFLDGLERYGCLGPRWGWLPRHVLVWDGDTLVGAVPMYLKYNSYGEFVFDWAWADAYQRQGLSYYPKLVVGVPYTPATGTRLLLDRQRPAAALAETLIDAARAVATDSEVSSLHWLFPHQEDALRLQDAGFMRRTGCQFHWHNRGYRDFDDFLQQFSSHNRKKVRRERRRVADAQVQLEVLDGAQASDEQWSVFHDFYRSTFDKRGGYPTLTLDFFRHLGRTLPSRVHLVLARHDGRYVAGALNLSSDTTLYGRHWGCEEDFHSLHFEACYYQGIELAIARGLQRFEPGAQGEHKVWRGFEPTFTWSAHWLANPAMGQAVARFLDHEHEAMEEYRRELCDHLPFKSTA